MAEGTTEVTAGQENDSRYLARPIQERTFEKSFDVYFQLVEHKLFLGSSAFPMRVNSSLCNGGSATRI